MTLVELLVTILIISILGALVLGVAAIAGETAREARTRNMIDRLHTLLMEHMDTYKTRRVKINPAVISQIESQFANDPVRRGQALAEARLYALRELMLMEMPDRWSDVLLRPVPGGNPANVVAASPRYLDTTNMAQGRSPLAQVYLRRYAQIAAGNPDKAVIEDNQSAECLYMIITLATGDGEARTLFHESNIGDTDGDGAPEFLDGWGNPINFLRWAPGFDSEIQSNANELDNPPSGTTETQAWRSAAGGDHDPYDVFRVDPTAFRLVPLIYSAGRDETYGLFSAPGIATWEGGNTPSVGNAAPYLQPPLSPYQKITITDPEAATGYLGTPVNSTATDNIHNHLIGGR